VKNWTFAFLLLACAGLQYLLPQIWAPLRYVDFFLILVFHAAIGTSNLGAVGRGWCAGLVQDLILSTYYPLGIQASAKMTAGLLAAVTGRLINLDHPGIQTIALLVLGCLNNGLVLLLFLIFGQPIPVRNLGSLLVGVLATAMVNVAIWWVSSWFRPRRIG
jgi:rod shape-determining protein MreD